MKVNKNPITNIQFLAMEQGGKKYYCEVALRKDGTFEIIKDEKKCNHDHSIRGICQKCGNDESK